MRRVSSKSFGISSKKDILQIVLFLTFILTVLTIVSPFKEILRRVFPLLSSKTAELEMGIFQTLISAYTIFFSLLVVAIEILHPRRLIEVKDILENTFVIKGTVLFLLFSTMPLLLIASGFFQPETPEHTMLFLLLFLVASIILVSLIRYLIHLLDPTFFIKEHSRGIIQDLLTIQKTKGIKEQVQLRERYTEQLNRLFDATRIAINSVDTYLVRTLIRHFFEISRRLELEWFYFCGFNENQATDTLIQGITKETQQKNNNASNEWGIYTTIGEFIWEPIWRIRNIGELTLTDSFLQSYYNFDLTMMILEAIKAKAYITARALTRCYWKLLIKAKRTYPDRKRVPEILAHGIFTVCGVLFRNFFELVKEIGELSPNELSGIERPGICYLFKYPNEPMKDVILDFIGLIFVLENKIGEQSEFITTVKDQTKEQLERKYKQYSTGILPDDIQHFFEYYQENIRNKLSKSIDA